MIKFIQMLLIFIGSLACIYGLGYVISYCIDFFRAKSKYEQGLARLQKLEKKVLDVENFCEYLTDKYEDMISHWEDINERLEKFEDYSKCSLIKPLDISYPNPIGTWVSTTVPPQSISNETTGGNFNPEPVAVVSCSSIATEKEDIHEGTGSQIND